jgi:hypothetical protein
MVGILVVSAVINASNVARAWAELTLLNYLVGIALWVALPIVAATLAWRGRPSGRWILVVLFAFRALAEVYGVAPLIAIDPSMLFAAPWRRHVVDALFFAGSAAWFLFSPGVRELRSKMRVSSSRLGL